MVFSRGRKRSREDDEAEAPTSWSPWNFMPQRKRARADAEERTCRLYYGGEEDGPLVQPCACRGTAKWVHKHCLEAWRRTAEREDAAYRCVQCMDHYRDALSIELLRDRLQVERAVGQTSSQVSHLAAAFELFAAINMIISPVTLLGGRLQAFQRHRDARLGVVRPGVLHEWRANHAEHKQRDREAVQRPVPARVAHVAWQHVCRRRVAPGKRGRRWELGRRAHSCACRIPGMRSPRHG